MFDLNSPLVTDGGSPSDPSLPKTASDDNVEDHKVGFYSICDNVFFDAEQFADAGEQRLHEEDPKRSRGVKHSRGRGRLLGEALVRLHPPARGDHLGRPH